MKSYRQIRSYLGLSTPVRENNRRDTNGRHTQYVTFEDKKTKKIVTHCIKHLS